MAELSAEAQAAGRAFMVRRSAGDIDELEDLFDAYMMGWDDNNRYRRALYAHKFDDSGWRMLGIMMIIVGAMLTGTTIMLAYAVPRDQLQPHWWLLAVFGLVFTLGGIPVLRRGLKINAEKQVRFDAKWTRPFEVPFQDGG